MNILRSHLTLFAENLKIFLTLTADLIDFAPLFRRGGTCFLSSLVHNEGPSGVEILQLLRTA